MSEPIGVPDALSRPPAPKPAGGARPSSVPLLRLRAAGQQVGTAILTLLVLSLITFGAINIQGPTAVARAAIGRTATDAQLDAYIRAHELDRPFPVRYGSWLGGFVQGDWGTSPVTGRSVRDDVLPKLGNTLLLALVAMSIALPCSVLLGLFMARRRGRASDMSVFMTILVINAMPEFVIGIALILLFAITLGWLPVNSTALSTGTLFEKAEAYALPAMTLVLAVVPYMARIARAAVGEALTASYTQAATLRGLSQRTVIWSHVMRNAAVPLVNAVAINIVYLLSGVVVVETLFAFPGTGYYLTQAIQLNDPITVQAIAMVMGAMFIGISLVADLAVVYFNPRLRSMT